MVLHPRALEMKFYLINSLYNFHYLNLSVVQYVLTFNQSFAHFNIFTEHLEGLDIQQ